MSDMINDNIEIYKGLQKTFERMKDGSTNAYLKILHAQEHYFQNQLELKSDYVETSTELLKAALRKFEYSVMVGEQLHSIRELRSLQVNPHIQGCYNIPSESENEFPFLDELLFDQSLFLWRSFLDFYMKYLVYFSTKNYVVNMNVGELTKRFTNAEENSKSHKLHEYFMKNVFNEGSHNSNWGNVLRSYRDKTAHNTLLNLTMKEVKTRTGQAVMEPTTQGQEISFFVQNTFENNAFYMLKDLMPILYEVEWIAGPYKPEMYLGEK
jgi:hypothetical protein